MAQFEDLLTLPALHSFVREAGFARPTAVQAASIPRLLNGQSISVLAQTGSGKTLAYALPVAEILKKIEAREPEHGNGAPRAWILSPTRELGSQIEKVFKAIAHHSKLRVRHVGGGDSPKRRRSGVHGPVDVLISSPSRALRALTTGELKADATRLVIFDEADQLFDPTFFADVKALVARLAAAHVQVGLFSATMPPTFHALRAEAFPEREFEELTLQGSHTLKNNIATENHTVAYKEKPEHALRILRKAQGGGFVFVNQKSTAEELFEYLTSALPDRQAYILHGGMEAHERRKVLSGFADDGAYLVCTDIAARGLDVPGLSWVLNYDLPFEAAYYMHRCGRVGRSGQPAQVYNLVTTKDRALIARINTAIANQSSLKLSRVVDVEAKRERKEANGARGKPRGPEHKTSGKPRGPERQTRGAPAKGRPTRGGKPAKGRPTNDRPTRGKPTKGRPTRGKPAAKRRFR